MTALMPWLGLGLLLLAGLGVVFTGIPAAVVLLATACFGVAIGSVSGDVPVQLLGVLPERLINLLENDLLQAIPLYVLMGALINRLPLADALYRCCIAIIPGPAAPVVSGFVLGALLGPMNGSVGASVLALSRVAEPRLAASGIALPRRAAIITVASTLGVVVPPSLVLILLGDAMLNAHTIAVTATGREDRVINTQDVFHGALVPAGLYLAACLLLGWWFNRRREPGETTAPSATPRPTVQQAVLAAVTVLAILILLGGVAAGYFYAVEAAAMGGFTLLIAGLVSGRLPLAVLNDVLRDVLTLTGALFFLLVAATTLTLVLRILGTDQLVAAWIAAIPGGTLTATLIVLAAIGLSALVLDAFEIIFVVVPIVIPPLLIRVADARWIAVLVLLALQASFLNPLIGYAVMMTRTVLKQPIPFPALLRSLLPYLFAQAALLLAVLLMPQLTHVGETAADRSRKPPAISDRDLEKRFEQMLPPIEPPPDIAAWQITKRGRHRASPAIVSRDFASALRTITDHEGLEGVFGDLPPQIFIVAEGVNGSQHLLVIGILGRFFGVDLIGRLQTRVHDRLTERAQLHAIRDQAFQGLRVAGSRNAPALRRWRNRRRPARSLCNCSAARSTWRG